MSEKDYVVRDLVLEKQDAIVNLPELYRMGQKWFYDHGYEFLEKLYTEKTTDEKEQAKQTLIKWRSFKKIDDYIKFQFKANLEFKNLKKIKDEHDRYTYRGDIKIKIECYLHKDYEEIWEANFLARFIREVYDKIVVAGKFMRYKDEFADEVYDFLGNMKAFLKIET
ncbi:MAG: hypothetical protein PHT54_02305 [Candidatus Nanoarchaeia archaeon]|nr:hypothetical protein [Candidatus Nanoarchaeia archaeon]